MTVHPTHALINLAAFRHNLGVVRDIVGPKVAIMAVVKSNAYGHGVLQIAREAVASGVSYLAVARIEEGIELREGGIDIPVLVFEIGAAGQLERAFHHGLEFTVSSLHGAAALSGIASRSGRSAKVHVKVDTGMGRLGLRVDEAAEVIESIARLRAIEIIAVWSHFATADEEDQTYARKQLVRFNEVLGQLERKKIQFPLRHMANSAGIIAFPEARFDIVRPGIMMYGVAPSRAMLAGNRLRPVMSVLSSVSFLKEMDAGSGVSYGRTFVTKKRTRIATIPIGYADGYFRGLSNRAEVIIRGSRYPVVGTVSMDQIMVEVGEESPVKENDVVTLIGRDNNEEITFHELAGMLGTIPYEIMCAVSARVARVILPN